MRLHSVVDGGRISTTDRISGATLARAGADVADATLLSAAEWFICGGRGSRAGSSKSQFPRYASPQQRSGSREWMIQCRAAPWRMAVSGDPPLFAIARTSFLSSIVLVSRVAESASSMSERERLRPVARMRALVDHQSCKGRTCSASVPPPASRWGRPGVGLPILGAAPGRGTPGSAGAGSEQGQALSHPRWKQCQRSKPAR